MKLSGFLIGCGLAKSITHDTRNCEGTWLPGPYSQKLKY